MLVVHHDGITKFGEVQADLMEPSGVDGHAHKRGFGETLYDSIAGEGANQLAFAAGEGKVDLAVIRGEPSGNQTEVLFFHAT